MNNFAISFLATTWKGKLVLVPIFSKVRHKLEKLSCNNKTSKLNNLFLKHETCLSSDHRQPRLRLRGYATTVTNLSLYSHCLKRWKLPMWGVVLQRFELCSFVWGRTVFSYRDLGQLVSENKQGNNAYLTSVKKY